MLPLNQFTLLYPLFKNHQSQLIRLKELSSQPSNDYSQPIPFPDQFYSWGQRKIFHQVQPSAAEITSINEVKSLIIENEQFPVNEFSNQTILKHLHSSGMNTQQTYQRLEKLYNIFKPQNAATGFLKFITQENYPNLESKLNSGLIYTYGKSINGLPIIILQVNKLDTKLSNQQNFATFYCLISLVLHYRMRPHYQEKYIFFIDLSGMFFSQIPYQYLFSFIDWIGLIFGGLSQKIFVFNSEKIGMFWQICKRLLPQSTVNKVTFVGNSLNEVYQMISPHQLQQKYGGSQINLKQFYPPKFPQNKSKVIMDLSSLHEQNHSETTEYFSFKEISMMESVHINPTYKTLGITTKRQIKILHDVEQYKIEKDQFSGKLSGFCGKSNEQCNCIIF